MLTIPTSRCFGSPLSLEGFILSFELWLLVYDTDIKK